MNILIVTQRYHPEPFRITDIAEELAKRGHQVTVVTGLPNYVTGYVPKDYKHGKRRDETINGVRVIRANEIGRRHDTIWRMLNYYSFPFSGKRILKKIDKKPDVILANGLSPIMAVEVALKAKKKWGSKVLLYSLDLWPESLLAGGIKKGSFIYSYYKKASAKIYRGCDRILTTTREHVPYIQSLPGCEGVDIGYLPQYAEAVFEQPLPQNQKKEGGFAVLFAGNMGKAQNLSNVIEAARILKDSPTIRFDLVGGGSELEHLKKQAECLPNVRFLESRPVTEMPALYSRANAMLVSLEDSPYANMTIPGKVQSYMAVGKPIIAFASGATAALVNDIHCGVSVNPNDPAELAKACLKLSQTDMAKMGSNGQNAYRKEFLRSVFFSRLIDELGKLTAKP